MRIYKTENWTFNENNQELIFADGTVRQLPSRLSRCLKTLLDAKGETVDYDQLLQVVWGTSFRDASTISSVISELRKLLGCGQSDKKFIVTVPKKGYRFLGYDTGSWVEHQEHASEIPHQGKNSLLEPVELQLRPELAIAADAQPIFSSQLASAMLLDPTSQARRRWFGLSIVLTLLLLAMFSLPLIFKSNEQTDLVLANVPVQYQQQRILTFEPGREAEFDVSFNKQWLAYVKEQNNKKRIILKHLQTGNLSYLPGQTGAELTSPTFSPDATTLLYQRHQPSGCEVWQMQLNQQGVVADSARKLTDCGIGEAWSTLAYSPDGTSIIFARNDKVSEPFRLFRRDLQTGYERNITSPSSSGRGDYSFALSPDGAQLAFIRNEHWKASTVWLLHLASGETKQLFSRPYLMYRLSWLDDRQLVYTSPEQKVYGFDLAVNQHQVLATLAEPVNYPLIREQNLYLTQGRSTLARLWQLDLATGALQTLTDSQYIDRDPAPSHNGSTYFISNRSGTSAIWQLDAQGLRQLPPIPVGSELKNLQDLSDDSLLGLLDGRLVRIDKTSTQLQFLTDKAQQIDSFSLSPQRDKVLFSHELNEVWFLEQFNISEQQLDLLGIQGFTAHFWQGDLLYTKFRQPGLWRYNLKQGAETLYVADFESYAASSWAIAGELLINTAPGKLQIYRMQPNSGELIREIQLKGSARNLVCSEKHCTLDIFGSGETEVIQLTPAKNND